MRVVIAIIFLLCLPAMLWAERVALVIGNYDYRSVAPLGNPRRDAVAVTEALKAQGFEVVSGDNLDRAGMQDALRRFRDVADGSDIALIYYAGHGIEIGGINYLVPVDARLDDERDAALEMIDLDQMLHQINGARQMKMVVLDACRNNPFVAKMQRSGGSRSVGRGLGDIRSAQADTLIAYAAAAGEVTPDGTPGRNSPFTEAFLAALSGPPTDVRQMLGRVRDRMRLTVPDSAPFVYSSLGGSQYVINPNSRAPGVEPLPTAMAATSAAAIGPSISEVFVRIDRDGTAEDWDAFLMQFEAQSQHPLYAFALEKRQVLLDAAGAVPPRRAEPTVAFLEPSGPVPQPPTPDVVAPDATVAAPMVPPPQTEDEAARAIQAELRDRGCYGGSIDGKLGRNSASALAAFYGQTKVPMTASRYPPLQEMILILDVLQAYPDTECPNVAAAPRRATAPAKSGRRKAAKPSSKCAVGWGTGVYSGFGTDDAKSCLD